MILLIDNYDSFTYNISDYLAQLGSEIIVKRNDEIRIDEIKNLSPTAIVISPGPKKPVDAGITMQLIDQFHQNIPLLGICLGYQAIGEYFGCSLVKSPVPYHGKTSQIYHSGTGIFENLPQPTTVMRYHSLNLSEISNQISITATTESGEPMALQHISLPLYGLQFHPESILTKHGMQMLRNWYQMIIGLNS